MKPWATLVGGGCFHPSTNPASHSCLPDPLPNRSVTKSGNIFFLLGKKALVSLDIHLFNVMDCWVFLLNGLVGNRSW